MRGTRRRGTGFVSLVFSLSLSFSLSLVFSLSRFLSLSLSLSVSVSLCLCVSVSLCFSHTLTLSLSHSLTLCLSRSLSLSHSLPLTLSEMLREQDESQPQPTARADGLPERKRRSDGTLTTAEERLSQDPVGPRTHFPYPSHFFIRN